MFIVSLTYVKPLEEVDAHLAEHVAYLQRQYRDGVFLASGRKVPRTGGIILARAADRQTLLRILAEDPFYHRRIADYEVVEFVPSMTAPELTMLREG
ncbi:hypothetical protein GURASL_26690 [Geotalea uraniireducens]|uniref:YCII-related domain-containing protein n=1 Tax=Geotalea uraniireducens TaxID=351604 RepID=A0ABN6VWX5_9BACT|nr:YciI family protein [Geotalea uraniireducens]BDV43746.1 hypothetical protein GURASL_26690 [Geotalea uraniireducens]